MFIFGHIQLQLETLENTPRVDTMEKISLFSTRYTLENTPPVDTMKKNKENFIDLNYNVNTVSMARTHCSIPSSSFEAMAIPSSSVASLRRSEDIAITSQDSEGIEQCVLAMLTVLIHY